MIRADGDAGPLDVNALIGPYPFRYVPHPDPEVLVQELADRQVQRAGVRVGDEPEPGGSPHRLSQPP